MSDPASAPVYPYDVINYPSPIVTAQTPNRIAAAGLMFGWEAPDPMTASVLEIGCGDAYNLIGCAAVAPHARHVGLDLSLGAIEAGRDLAKRAGLANVELHHADILTFPREGNGFDYIIAHGVYAWVPQPVREALLALTAARLKPGGIAYVSYDVLPGSAGKQAIVSFMRPRLAAIPDVAQRIDAAYDLVRTLARTQTQNSRLRSTLDPLVARLDDYEPGHFFHDWMSEAYEPSSLSAFARAAARHGLSVVGDAELGDLYFEDLDEAARNWLATEGRDAASHGALLDMLRGNVTFRRTLLNKAGDLLPVAWDGIKRLRFAFLGTRTEGEEPGIVSFRAPSQATMTTSNPGELAILDTLHASGSEEMTLDELAGQSGQPEELVARVLRQAAVVGLLEIQSTPPPYTLTPGDRPRAGGLVRAMFAEGDWAINLRHLRVSAGNLATRLMTVFADGTRDHAGIAGAMSETLGVEVTAETVADGIEELAQRYLFEA